MIKSFRCPETQAINEGRRSVRFASFKAIVERKLQMLDSAHALEFLRSPPGNRLESLKGTQAGQHSIRINDQWRICFVWTQEGPQSVEIVDSTKNYH